MRIKFLIVFVINFFKSVRRVRKLMQANLLIRYLFILVIIKPIFKIDNTKVFSKNTTFSALLKSTRLNKKNSDYKI